MRYRSLALPPRLMLPLCLALAACATPHQREVTYATWKQAPAFAAPQVKVAPVRLAVPFATADDELSDESEAALDDFLGRNRIGSGATVDLAVAPADADQPETRARIAAVERSLGSRGIMVETVQIVDDGKPGTVDILGRKVTIQPPACPGYNAPVSYDAEWQPVQSPGCSDTVNLEMMVANPADLARGRVMPPADAEASAIGVAKYRAGQVAPLTTSMSAGGSIQ